MSSNSSQRENWEWVRNLNGTDGPDAQRRAHADLATYLYVVAFNYLERRRNSVPVLSEFDGDELAELSQDFVQDTLGKLANNNHELLEQYSGAGRFTSWAAQIITNQIASELRRPYWRRRGALSEELFAQQVDTETPLPETRVLISELHQVLQSCLDKLSDRYRIAFLRCIVEGDRAEDVAEDLDTTSNAVYLLVFRSKRNLRKCVTKSGIGPDALNIFPK